MDRRIRLAKINIAIDSTNQNIASDGMAILLESISSINELLDKYVILTPPTLLE